MPWKALRNAAYLLLLMAAVISAAHWWPQLSRIWSEHALTFAGGVVLMALGTAVQARNFISFIGMPAPLRTSGMMDIWALAALTNYLGPFQPGIAVRMVYLSQHGISVTQGLLATWRQLCVSLWIALAGLSIGLGLMRDVRGYGLAVLAGSAFLGMAVLRKGLLSGLEHLRQPLWLAERRQLLHAAASGIPLQGIIGVVLQYALGTVLLLWVYRRFGADMSIGQALVVACAVYASSLVALLPGNLGIAEALYMVGGNSMGLSLAEAAALAALLRIAHVVANLAIVLVGALVRSLNSGSKHAS